MVQEPREPQPGANQPAFPPGYPPQQYQASANPYYAPPAAPTSGDVTGRTLRLLVHRFLRLQILFWRWVGSRIGWVLTIAALLGVIAWLSILLLASRAATPPDPRVAAIPPVAAAESYLLGKQSSNAEQMWSSYSPAFQTAQLQRGITKDNLQARADAERRSGYRYTNYEYIGGVSTGDGGGLYYYAIRVELGDQNRKFPYVFTVDADGKITDIDGPQFNQQQQPQQ